MARILVVGIATLDIINSVDGYPAEDAEIRALASELRRGGNAANTAVVLAQLGHACDWAGVLSDDRDGDFISADLGAFGVGLMHSYRISGGRTPTSYITMNQRNGSRTIVHYRDLPEYSATHFETIDLKPYDWLHVEGRQCQETRTMLQFARQQRPDLPISIEIEKPRPDIEILFDFADLLLFSRGFADAGGYLDATALLQSVRTQVPETDLVCAWGADGAWYSDHDSVGSFHVPAVAPMRVVDTLAAGDTFNAAVIAARCRGLALSASVEYGCRVAGYKCGLHGLNFDASLPS
jgi:ketohexokinase